MIVTIGEARNLAEGHLAKTAGTSPEPVVIVDDSTIETDFGWIFFWNSKRYLESGDFRDALAGNVPLIVDRANGSVHATCTFLPIEEIIERYRTVRGTLGTAPFAQALFAR
jgi:Immunity protein 35